MEQQVHAVILVLCLAAWLFFFLGCGVFWFIFKEIILNSLLISFWPFPGNNHYPSQKNLRHRDLGYIPGTVLQSKIWEDGHNKEGLLLNPGLLKYQLKGHFSSCEVGSLGNIPGGQLSQTGGPFLHQRRRLCLHSPQKGDRAKGVGRNTLGQYMWTAGV